MNGWLIINGFLRSEKFEDLYRLLDDAFRAKGATLTVFPNTAFVNPTGFPLTPSKDDQPPDFVIFWDKDIALARRFENAGIAVFNSSAAIACCDDKIQTALALTRRKVPTPRTIFAPKTFEGVGRDSLDLVVEELPLSVCKAFWKTGREVATGEMLDSLADLRRKNVAGQMDLFGSSGQQDVADIPMPRVEEYSRQELAAMDLTLIDVKIEIGFDEDGKVYVVDEITPDIWRVKDKNGVIPNQIDCAELILEKI